MFRVLGRTLARCRVSAQPQRRLASSLDLSIGLSDEQKEFQRVALDFADKQMRPHAEHW